MIEITTECTSCEITRFLQVLGPCDRCEDGTCLTDQTVSLGRSSSEPSEVIDLLLQDIDFTTLLEQCLREFSQCSKDKVVPFTEHRPAA